MVRVYFIQQSHDFFAQVERSGVAGRRSAVRQPHKAEETHESGESQPHVGYNNSASSRWTVVQIVKWRTCSSFKGWSGRGKKKKWWTMTWKRSEAEENIWGLLCLGEQILCSCMLQIPGITELHLLINTAKYFVVFFPTWFLGLIVPKNRILSVREFDLESCRGTRDVPGIFPGNC